MTRVATSRDRIRFEVNPEVLGRTYMRAFEHDGVRDAPCGQFYRSRNGPSGFEEGPPACSTGHASAGAVETW